MAASSPCYVCQGATRVRSVGGSALVVCPRCGFGRTHSAAPAADYWSRRDDVDHETSARYWTDARSAVYRGALALLEAQGGRGRVLDVGGGIGHFAQTALAMGWDAYSVDVSDVAVAAAAERIGGSRSLAAISGSLEGTFDAVTLWCVIAHTTDPRPLLTDALRALRPGGRLFLTTPNFRFQIRYARALAALGRPMDFSAHDHVVHFTTESLARTLDAVGVRSWQHAYVGITEDCVAYPDLARWVVPAKRAWNAAAAGAARVGGPHLGSELQVVGIAP